MWDFKCHLRTEAVLFSYSLFVFWHLCCVFIVWSLILFFPPLMLQNIELCTKQTFLWDAPPPPRQEIQIARLLEQNHNSDLVIHAVIWALLSLMLLIHESVSFHFVYHVSWGVYRVTCWLLWPEENGCREIFWMEYCSIYYKLMDRMSELVRKDQCSVPHCGHRDVWNIMGCVWPIHLSLMMMRHVTQ